MENQQNEQETAVVSLPAQGIQVRSNPGCLLTPKTMGEAMEFAKLLAESDLAPKDFKGKPGNCLVAMQMGAEVGLAPMQALQNIAVINGRPSVWGDAALAIVQASGKLEWIKEGFEGDGDQRKAYCITKRIGYPEPKPSTFSVAEAKQAGLWSKDLYQKYPDRMLKARARGFNLRDQFADVLKGLAIREEVEDFEVIETTAVPSLEELMPKSKSEGQTAPSEPARQNPPAPPREEPRQRRESNEESPFYTSDFNGKTYLWAQVGEFFSHQFLQELGMKESPKKPGWYYSQFREEIEEQLALRCEEVPS